MYDIFMCKPLILGLVTASVHFLLFFDGFAVHARRPKPLFIILSPDFYELWRSMMSTTVITEEKQQWPMLVQGDHLNSRL